MKRILSLVLPALALGFTTLQSPTAEASSRSVRAHTAPVVTHAAPAPAPRAKKVWVPGHFELTLHGLSWVSGHYAVAPAGRSVYVAGHWEVKRGHRVWVKGYWR